MDKTFLRQEYISRINRVIDFIEQNLHEELSLEKLADVSNFSRFHFHRIFKTFVGETLNQFINRVRIEKAASQLIINPRKSITEIALDCGYSGSAAFSRSFKEIYKMSPSQWRAGGFIQESKNCKTESKSCEANGNKWKEFDISSFYIDDVTFNQKWRIKMKDEKQIQVEVKEMPEMNVAYVRHIGPYAGDAVLFENLFKKLMNWAGPRNLLRFPETLCMSVYHDNPKITDEGQLRLSVCITVPEDTQVDGEIGKMKISGGKFAVGRFELTNSNEYEGAWNALIGGWLPESGYQLDDRLSYELYHNDPKEHPEGKHIVDICVPVKPL